MTKHVSTFRGGYAMTDLCSRILWMQSSSYARISGLHAGTNKWTTYGQITGFVILISSLCLLLQTILRL